MAGQRTEIELLRAVIDTQRLIHAGHHDVDEIMAIVTTRSQELTGADAAVVKLLDGHHLLLRAASGALTDFVGARVSALGSAAGRCIAERRARRCDDTHLDAEGDADTELYRAVGVRSSVVVPLIVPSGECVGSLAVFASRAAAFDDGDVEVLDAMSDFVATALRQADEAAERESRALRDDLTGLANRSLLLDRLAVALARATRSGDPVTVLFLDLDGFKAVNQRLGHHAGDQVLRLVGRALRSVLRPSDAVSRLGGDEFVVACESMPADEVPELIERLRWAVACAWAGELPITATVGTARSSPVESAEALLARAGAAMEQAKRGR